MKNKKSLFKTKRLCMEAKMLEELRDAWRKESDPEVKKTYQDRIDGVEAHPTDWLWYTDWTISLTKEKIVIGSIGFKGAPDENAEVEIGCRIAEAYRRQGYGLEAVKRMTEWAFSDEKVYYIMAEMAPDNIASGALLKKTGFVEAKTTGETGARFEKERPETSYMTLFLPIGMCLGMGIGIGLSLYDNLALGMSVGMALGTGLGYVMDTQDKKKREELRERRKEKE